MPMEDEFIGTHRIEQLIGISSSKRTYYSTYREQERRLDRAIASIASISDALCTTTSGVPSLARAIVRVATQQFEAEWASLALCDGTDQHWVARFTNDGAVVLDDGSLPPALDATVRQVISRQALVISDAAGAYETVGAPMVLEGRVVGALVVMLGHGVTLDKRELSVLQTFANQAAVAVRNARLYEESERLRVQITQLYEEACSQKTELESKNRQLANARRWLAMARQSEVVNTERSRIARDLHDSVAQYLICIGMNLEWCRAQLDEASPLYERICGAKELARSAVTRMRATIFELSTIDDTRLGLVSALHELVIDFEKTAQLSVQLRISGDPRPLDSDAEHALYQIAQEALFNVYKHAQARSAMVEMRFQPDAAQLVISDDGVGITRDVLQTMRNQVDDATARYGLRNMRSRARELGGSCTIARRQRGGTQVRVKLPLPRS